MNESVAGTEALSPDCPGGESSSCEAWNPGMYMLVTRAQHTRSCGGKRMQLLDDKMQKPAVRPADPGSAICLLTYLKKEKNLKLEIFLNFRYSGTVCASHVGFF